MSPKTGRPPIEEPKKNEYKLRMTDKELKMLEECCEKTKLLKSEILRTGLYMVYEKYCK